MESEHPNHAAPTISKPFGPIMAIGGERLKLNNLNWCVKAAHTCVIGGPPT
jgi:hypothetical protein